ncbi:hypothetical protein ES703_117121 [subsurface metagenome]
MRPTLLVLSYLDQRDPQIVGQLRLSPFIVGPRILREGLLQVLRALPVAPSVICGRSYLSQRLGEDASILGLPQFYQRLFE